MSAIKWIKREWLCVNFIRIECKLQLIRDCVCVEAAKRIAASQKSPCVFHWTLSVTHYKNVKKQKCLRKRIRRAGVHLFLWHVGRRDAIRYKFFFFLDLTSFLFFDQWWSIDNTATTLRVVKHAPPLLDKAGT